MAFHVRRVRPDEWPALRAFRLRALATDPRAFGATLAEEEALPDDAWRERARKGAQGPDDLVAVAEDASGAWLGMVGGRRLEAPHEREVIALWTAPEARGRGVGEALLRFVARWAEDAGAGRVVRDGEPRGGPPVRPLRVRGRGRGGAGPA